MFRAQRNLTTPYPFSPPLTYYFVTLFSSSSSFSFPRLKFLLMAARTEWEEGEKKREEEGFFSFPLIPPLRPTDRPIASFRASLLLSISCSPSHPFVRLLLSPPPPLSPSSMAPGRRTARASLDACHDLKEWWLRGYPHLYPRQCQSNLKKPH